MVQILKNYKLRKKKEREITEAIAAREKRLQITNEAREKNEWPSERIQEAFQEASESILHGIPLSTATQNDINDLFAWLTLHKKLNGFGRSQIRAFSENLYRMFLSLWMSNETLKKQLHLDCSETGTLFLVIPEKWLKDGETVESFLKRRNGEVPFFETEKIGVRDYLDAVTEPSYIVMTRETISKFPAFNVALCMAVLLKFGKLWGGDRAKLLEAIHHDSTNFGIMPINPEIMYIEKFEPGEVDDFMDRALDIGFMLNS